jgi:hypothetical protein
MNLRIIKRNQIPVPHWFLHMIKPLAVGFSGIQAMAPFLIKQRASGFIYHL